MHGKNNKFGITKKFTFEGAHIVRNAKDQKCALNVHGHSYIVELTLEAILGVDDIQFNAGMVKDFSELREFKNYIADNLDHAMLFWIDEDPTIINFFKEHFDRVLVMNDNPTAENIAKYLYEIALRLYGTDNYCTVKRVKVHETATGSAYYGEY